nr:PREDICTED: E3 ubiquitin-protein ligase RBBP6-like [Paralichthys olivaceus]
MSCVHYSFFSKRDSSVVTFDGLYITLHRLRRQIMAQERLKERNCHLQISNAQTREEYTDDEAHIPKHSSVIVRRTPSTRVKPYDRKFIVDRSDTAVVGSSRPKDSSGSMSLAQLAKTANLVDANASEEDKIRAMMSQSNHEYTMDAVTDVHGQGPLPGFMGIATLALCSVLLPSGQDPGREQKDKDPSGTGLVPLGASKAAALVEGGHLLGSCRRMN